MRYLIYVTIVFVQTVYADFNKYVEIYTNSGFDAACEKVDSFYQETTSYYEKAFFEAQKMHCIRHKYETSEEFKRLPKEEKKQYYEGIKEQLRNLNYSNLNFALDSDELPNKDLLDRIGPTQDFPELYEKWKKKVIDRYLNHRSSAPNENEGDVHSPVNFVRSDYESMIEAYVRNDKLDDAQRLAREYGESYPWSSQEDTMALMERIEKQKAYFAKKRAKEAADEEEPENPVDPIKATAKLQEAMDAYDAAKAKTLALTPDAKPESKQSEKTDSSVSNAESDIQTMIREYGPIVAIIVVVLLYLRSRRSK